MEQDNKTSEKKDVGVRHNEMTDETVTLDLDWLRQVTEDMESAVAEAVIQHQKLERAMDDSRHHSRKVIEMHKRAKGPKIK